MSSSSQAHTKRPKLPDAEDDAQASVPGSDEAFAAPRRKRRRKKRRRKKSKWRIRRVNPSLVFIATLAFALWAMFGGTWPSTIACVLIGFVLFVDDRYGFSWSSSLRRSYTVRDNFTRLEVITLLILFGLDAIIAFRGWVYELRWLKVDWFHLPL